MRLDRLLSTLGCGSRSEVGRIIRHGAVRVNGVPVTDPGAAWREGDEVLVEGRPLDARLERHVILHKPAGLLTAARDKKQPTVMDLLPPYFANLGCMPVGRLDKDTTGLLFFTTDGELNHRLLAPGRHVDKTYYAEVDGPLTTSDADAFRDGLDLGDFVSREAVLDILSSSPEKACARVTVHEGRFHQVKRMFEAVGRTVTRLHRETFGPLTLEDSLPVGQWRELTPDELNALRLAVEETK